MMALRSAYRGLVMGVTASPSSQLSLLSLRACACTNTTRLTSSLPTTHPLNRVSLVERAHGSPTPSQLLLAPSVRRLTTAGSLLGRSDYYWIKKEEAGKFTMPKMWHVPQHLLDRDYWRHQRKGGRGEDGRIKIRHMGGGHQRNLRIVDHMRTPLLADGDVPVPVKDRVIEIGYDPFRSGRIALVAGSGMDAPKLILAADEMKVGDVITAYRGPPESMLTVTPGDAYPLKHLPIGTMIHNVEMVPGGGGKLARTAGSHFVISRKTEDTVVISNPLLKGVTKQSRKSKERIHTLNEECLAVLGRVSNPDHHTRKIGKAGRARWMNQRPRGQTGKDRWHHRNKMVAGKMFKKSIKYRPWEL